MTSSGIGPDPDPLHTQYRVEEIERLRWEEKKKGKKAFLEEPPDNEKLGLSAFMILLFEKAFESLKKTIKKGLFGNLEAPIKSTLQELKEAFEMMMKVDMSQEAPFLKRLSRLWQEALDASLEVDSSPALAQEFKKLLQDIEANPKDEEHTFGYYLTEYAGQKWLPFPYMELIRKLHRQHALDPESSLLSRWTSMIEEILNRT